VCVDLYAHQAKSAPKEGSPQVLQHQVQIGMEGWAKRPKGKAKETTTEEEGSTTVGALEALALVEVSTMPLP
jgi:hypothetical protein